MKHDLIPPQLLHDIEAFARTHQARRGAVGVRVIPGFSSMIFFPLQALLADGLALNDAALDAQIASAVAVYDQAREYIAVLMIDDPINPSREIRYVLRRDYGGAIVSTA